VLVFTFFNSDIFVSLFFAAEESQDDDVDSPLNEGFFAKMKTSTFVQDGKDWRSESVIDY
jgi:hypothetical protein